MLNQGGYVGSSSAFIAVLNRERRLAEFIADNEFDDEPTFDRTSRLSNSGRTPGTLEP